MNKLNRLLAAGLIASASAGLAATSVLAAPVPAMPSASPTATATKPTAHHAHARKAHVERVQKALNTSGANLKVDGIWGSKTKAAVRDFQKSHGLKATGRLDKATRRQLNLRAA